MSSCDRKSLLLATGILVAGGTAAYMQSRFSSRTANPANHCNGIDDENGKLESVGKDNATRKISTKKRSGLRSLKVLTAILLSKMGQSGARDLLALVTILVSYCMHTLSEGCLFWDLILFSQLSWWVFSCIKNLAPSPDITLFVLLKCQGELNWIVAHSFSFHFAVRLVILPSSVK